MSGKSRVSGSMRSSAGSVRLAAPAAGAGSHELALDALYERKRDKKSVRVLTVIVYVFCVSLAAIILSLYYVFFWEPKDAQYAQRKVAHTVEQTSTTPLPTCFMPHTGRSNTKVSDTVTPSIDISNSSHNISEFPSATYNLSNVTGETSIIITTEALLTEKSTLADSTLFDISNETSDDIGAYNFTSNSTNVT